MGYWDDCSAKFNGRHTEYTNCTFVIYFLGMMMFAFVVRNRKTLPAEKNS
ncbi:hypothetical protein D515_04710 [Grimontia indica]|uniref:Uncharacterized protein n=1 Tax=Grimontia indica TaxID=1056512 RepID=R1GLL4_9GAMM|nr:hypothetical protein D515_04710 [Grimontia indica]